MKPELVLFKSLRNCKRSNNKLLKSFKNLKRCTYYVKLIDDIRNTLQEK